MTRLRFAKEFNTTWFVHNLCAPLLLLLILLLLLLLILLLLLLLLLPSLLFLPLLLILLLLLFLLLLLPKKREPRVRRPQICPCVDLFMRFATPTQL